MSDIIYTKNICSTNFILHFSIGPTIDCNDHYQEVYYITSSVINLIGQKCRLYILILQEVVRNLLSTESTFQPVCVVA